MMETVWVERQRKADLFCQDTEEQNRNRDRVIRKKPILKSYVLQV